MFKTFRMLSIVSILVLILAACNLPSAAATQDPNNPNVVFTAAALTVQAQLTQTAPFNTLTLPPPPPTNTAVTIPTSLPPTNTPVVLPTQACDQAQFIKDVTISDGTVIAPGNAFKKTWRLKNIGTCTWSGYTLVFDRGEAMSPVIESIGTVASGQEVDVTVNFTAPTANNTYRSYWRIRNSAGVLIPVVGGNEGKSFYVEIKVAAVSSGYDFHTRAGDATWTTGAGVQSFPGSDGNSNGFANYQNNQKAEDGNNWSKILQTHPQWLSGGSSINGLITGLFPSYTVVTGERFKARIGFLANCGSANVKFQLQYKDSGGITTLKEWSETCNGGMTDVDVDLSGLASKTVQFILQVQANSAADQASAVWINPQIAIP